MSRSEFEIIAAFFASLTPQRDDVVLGIGDDCALLQPPAGKLLAVSSDTLVEGVHFFPGCDAHALGHKALAVNLSDLAAMGAEPAWVSLALTLPEADENWLSAFAAGFRQLAEQHHVQLVGGDTTRGPLSISITIQGFVAPDKVLRRSGAQIGDLVCVTGQLGGAALAVELINAGMSLPDDIQQKLDYPVPRIAAGQQLAQHATAAIDVSDGLLADLGHILQASGAAAELSAAAMPMLPAVQHQAEQQSRWDLPLSGGDDYELCFTIAPQHQSWLLQLAENLDCPVTVVGHIVPGEGISVTLSDGSLWQGHAAGYQHFS
ncbi:MAG: thiamine-phosphate kinase [Chromatiales bacterium]|jgi:thiamine-monophosphate kinase